MSSLAEKEWIDFPSTTLSGSLFQSMLQSSEWRTCFWYPVSTCVFAAGMWVLGYFGGFPLWRTALLVFFLHLPLSCKLWSCHLFYIYDEESGGWGLEVDVDLSHHVALDTVLLLFTAPSPSCLRTLYISYSKGYCHNQGMVDPGWVHYRETIFRQISKCPFDNSKYLVCF